MAVAIHQHFLQSQFPFNLILNLLRQHLFQFLILNAQHKYHTNASNDEKETEESETFVISCLKKFEGKNSIEWSDFCLSPELRMTQRIMCAHIAELLVPRKFLYVGV